MEDLLASIGLTKLQAQAYLWLLDNKQAAPPQLAKSLNITRTNTYKVLDSLVELGLASKSSSNKKLQYQAEDPIAIYSIVAEQRNRVIALEQTSKEIVFDLRRKFNKSSANTAIKTFKGKEAAKSAYAHQAELKEPIYLILGRSDRISMGFEAMNAIRFMANRFNTKRYGITPDVVDAPANPDLDKRSNLTRTWIDTEDYRSPVEWTVSGDELMVVNFDDQTSGIQIKDAAIADSFRQLWQAMDKNLRANPSYKKLPRKAKRTV